MAIEDIGFEAARPRRPGEPLPVAQLEREVGSPLPGRLARLLERSGGSVHLDPCRIRAVGPVPSTMHRFLGSSPFIEPAGLLGRNSGDLGLLRTFQMYVGRVKPGLVPFAWPYTAGDQLFCDLSRDGGTRVYFWWHESPTPEDSDESLLLVAESMDDFCDRVEPFERPD